MRVTEYSIALPTGSGLLLDSQAKHRADVAGALKAGQDRWRIDGAPAATSARALLLGVCARAGDAGSARRMTIKTEIDEGIAFPASAAIRVGLIAEALLNNAISHAHPSGVTGEIVVRCVRERGDVLIEVADDGVGMPEAFDIASHGGGLTLAALLVAELGAELKLNTGACGLQAELRVPTLTLVPGK